MFPGPIMEKYSYPLKVKCVEFMLMKVQKCSTISIIMHFWMNNHVKLRIMLPRLIPLYLQREQSSSMVSAKFHCHGAVLAQKLERGCDYSAAGCNLLKSETDHVRPKHDRCCVFLCQNPNSGYSLPLHPWSLEPKQCLILRSNADTDIREIKNVC